jgi:hypothetical protein
MARRPVTFVECSVHSFTKMVSWRRRWVKDQAGTLFSPELQAVDVPQTGGEDAGERAATKKG